MTAVHWRRGIAVVSGVVCCLGLKLVGGLLLAVLVLSYRRCGNPIRA